MSTLIVEETDGIVKVQFNREKDTNSFSRQMTLELTAAKALGLTRTQLYVRLRRYGLE